MTPCDHAHNWMTPEGNTKCADCGAVAIWPDDPDAECEIDDCDWPTCMTLDCEGPLGDGVPPEWITPRVAIRERTFDAAGEGLSAPAEDDREDEQGVDQ